MNEIFETMRVTWDSHDSQIGDCLPGNNRFLPTKGKLLLKQLLKKALKKLVTEVIIPNGKVEIPEKNLHRNLHKIAVKTSNSKQASTPTLPNIKRSAFDILSCKSLCHFNIFI